jgi:phosphatidylglycerophosphatase A
MGNKNVLCVKIASSAFGLGHLPVAPGTWASGGVAVLYVIIRWMVPSGWPSVLVMALLFAAVLIAGVPLAQRAEVIYGREDPRHFVLDEVAGMWLIFLLFQWRGPMVTAVFVFFAFRVFDVLKPPPIRRIEHLPDGWGVMADDLAAALYSIGALWLLCHGMLEPILSG